MKIALGQINTTIGDFAGNTARMVRAAREAAEGGADLVVFPELSITGYPPRDLVERNAFVASSEHWLEMLAAETAELPLSVICGYAARRNDSYGKGVENAAALVSGGLVRFRQPKMLLPTYDVFDEARYFEPGRTQELCLIAGRQAAVAVCEDAWNDKQFWPRPLYERDPVQELAAAGAEILISINSSPYHTGKRALRREIFSAMARRHSLPLIYVNQVGGNDSLVFDGSSFAMDHCGRVIASGPSFAEDLVFVDVSRGRGDIHQNLSDEFEALYEALVLGTRDYVRKCGFRSVLIGLSGGMDSSLTAAVAVDAVGAANVTGVGMPGPFSSDGSIADARALAENLGIRFELVPITGAYQEFLRILDPVFAGAPQDVTEENLQARLRGVTLMALSNKRNSLVLTTGNKSELAVGYCTLYGDMCGGLAVISDVPKTDVYALARVANQRHHDAIPESVFEKPPSAELRPDQKDTDSLPAYDVLDQILRQYVEESRTPREIARNLDLPLSLVTDIAKKIDCNEYKRQ